MVAIADLAPADITEAVVAAISGRGGGAFAVRTDVADEAEVLSLFEAVQGRLGGLDILVNNAGILIEKPLLETTTEDFDRLIGVNLRGAFLVGRQAIRLMTLQGGGRVINIASELAYLGRANCSVYCASKGAILAMTRAVGARVRAGHPGQRDCPRPHRHGHAGTGIDLAGDACQGSRDPAWSDRSARGDRGRRRLPRRTRRHLHDRPVRQPERRCRDVLTIRRRRDPTVENRRWFGIYVAVAADQTDEVVPRMGR